MKLAFINFSSFAKVYESKFQSKSKFSDSGREWSNTIKLSNWEAVNNAIIPYPEAITPPKPDSLEITPEVDLNNTYGVSTNRFYFQDDQTLNNHIDNQVVLFDFEKTFGASLPRLRTLGYKFLTINYDIEIKINNDITIFKKNYSGNSLTLDITQANDRIRKNIVDSQQKHATWVYREGSVGGADKIGGELILLSQIDFRIINNNISIDYSNQIRLKNYIWTALVVPNFQYFELNGDYPISWYLNIKPKKLKLTK